MVDIKAEVDDAILNFLLIRLVRVKLFSLN